MEDAIALKKDLDGPQGWERDCLMEFHPKKCQIMYMTNKRKIIKHPGQTCCKPKLCLPKVLWTSSSNWWQYTSTITQVDLDETLLDVEASLCHLGDMLSAGGGCYNQVLYCLGKVQEASVNPEIQAHIPHSSWEGVWRLCPLCSSLWERKMGSASPRLIVLVLSKLNKRPRWP